MASNPPTPPGRGWRGGAAGGAAGGGGAGGAAGGRRGGPTAPGGWRGGTQPTEEPVPGGGRSRKTLIAAVVGGIGLTIAVIVAVFLWLRPPKPPLFVFIDAGYEQNLAVPHNVAGRKGINAIQSWVNSYNEQRKGAAKPITVKSATLQRDGDTVAESLAEVKPRNEVVVVFLAAHGGADGDGPYVIPHDADLSNRAQLYRLNKALETLRKLPAKTRKLLVVDATQVTSHLPSGQLHNHFARALANMESSIKEIPNLMVLSASRENQRSWVAPEWQRTIFAHFILQGLRGNADREVDGDNNGRVTTWELYRYVQERVKNWARHNRGALQEPVLFGDEKAAREMELVLAGADKEEAVPPLKMPDELKSVEAVWREVVALQAAHPSPLAYSPQLWRRYLDSALRYEQLVLAGADQKDIDGVKGSLSTLRGQIDRERSLRYASLQLSVGMPAALGVDMSPTERATQKKAIDSLVALWQAGETNLEEYDRVLAPALRAVGNDRTRQQVFQLRALRAVLHEAAEGATLKLDLLVRVLAKLESQLDLRPTESHYPAIMNAAAPAKTVVSRRPDLVRKALAVHLEAEEAALGLTAEDFGERANLPAYSEQVFALLKDEVEAADRNRRKGMDLLFTEDEARWREAENNLIEAGQAYARVKRKAVALRQALHLRNEALVELPYHSRWEQSQEDRVKAAWVQTHKLNAALKFGVNPVSSDEKTLDLEKLVRDSRAALATVRKHLADTPSERKFTATQGSVKEIEQILGLPFLDVKTRMELVSNFLTFSHELNSRTEKTTPAGGQTAEEAARASRDLARRQGRLALAMLGPDWERNYQDVAVQIAQNSDDAWASVLAQKGADLAVRGIQAFPEMAQGLTDKAGKGDLNRAREDLALAETAARQVEGAAVGSRLTLDPVGDRRKILTHDLLRWQARRAYLDFWAWEDPQRGTAYFRDAGGRYAADAQALVTSVPARFADLPKKIRDERLTPVLASRAEIDGAGQLVLFWIRDKAEVKGNTNVNLTDEREVKRTFRLSSAGGPLPEGDPVVRVSLKGGLQPAAKGQEQWAPCGGFKKDLTDFPLVTIPNETRPLGQDEGNEQRVAGFFRGHLSEFVTNVRYYRYPDIAQHMPLPRGPGRVAVVSRGLETEYSAIAIVFDCSGSMTTPSNNTTRFEKALEALGKVLRDLPAGVTISVRVLGGFGANDGVDAFRTRSVISKQVWKKGDEAEVIRKIRDIGASGGTPLIRALGEAVDQDFPKQEGAIKTIVAITDGADTAHNKTLNGKSLDEYSGGRSVVDYMRFKFNKADVSLNVIGFEVSDKEKQESNYAPFVEIVNKLGTYVDTKDADQLVNVLRRAVLLRFEIDEADNLAWPKKGWHGMGRALDTYPPPPLGPFDVTPLETDKRRPQNFFWSRPGMPAHDYRLRIRSNQRIQQRIRVNPGESLVLELGLDPMTRRPGFRRSLYGMIGHFNDFHVQWPKNPEKPGVLKDEDWLLSVVQNEITTRNDLQMMVLLEQNVLVGTEKETLQQIKPALAWYEITPRGQERFSSRLAVTPLFGYPGPAWDLRLPGWPKDRTTRNPVLPLPPTLDTWWVARTLPADNIPLGDIEELNRSGRVIERVFRGAKEPPTDVTIQSVTYERVRFYTSPDESAEERCLVVRMTYAPNTEPFLVQIPGEARLGEKYAQWHRFYREAGKYVGYFVIDETQFRNLKALNLISVARFKEEAQKVEKLELPRPDSTYRRPQLPPQDD